MTMDIISGYEINEELYKSLNSLVYRGRRKVDDQPVILKMLNRAYPSPEKIAWFKREYAILQSLNPAVKPTVNGKAAAATAEASAPAGVIEAYSLETDQHRWVMTLEDFGGESLTRLGQAGKLTLTEFLKLAIHIVDILGQVHQQHIMHKDINPSNIVLNPMTGQVKLIDFGISTALSREKPILRNPNVLEGTLAYISPEQTGRMNRAMDYRTDFYSLGVTFYELLTGQLPFPTGDAMEIVHAHLAREALPPQVRNVDVPPVLSDIVMKLMAKNAEDRYQSTQGLKADLEECLWQWQTAGRIDSFSPGRHDTSDRFQTPQRLYGREREIETFLATFERVSQGTSEIMLVMGYAGIGKSALVQEIYKPITHRRGYFIAGKFDQLQRNTPYASLVRAFSDLIRQILTDSEAQIAIWRDKLLTALGPNGQIIIEVIPEMELIIGPQPVIPDLPPTEAENRFNLVFQNFIRVFTQPEHPLVIFLDDLQWADAASLQLIKLIVTDPDSQYLFVIGAYRDDEVSAAHPLMLSLGEIRQAKPVIHQISLPPLSLSHVTQFTADTLSCTPEIARPLAELVQAKTNGNPFFIIEFLKSLYEAGLLTFDFERRSWRWDLEQIQTRNITDNVVKLMADRMSKFREETKQVLKLAACIGNQFDLSTLAIVYEKSPRQTAIDLWEAIVDGLILPLEEAYKLMDLDVQGLADEVTVEYKFAHDRIQQAAYSLISDVDKRAIHRQVGQLLLHSTRTRPEEREQKIFDIVDQLNLGRALIDQQAERDELAHYNLLAGRKAKGSAAYQPAFNYLRVGLELLDSSDESADSAGHSWERNYELTLALHTDAAETAYMSTEFEEMERLIGIVMYQATTLLDKVRVYEIQIQAHMAQYKWLEAVQTGLSVLELLQIRFPEKPKQWHIILGLVGTKLTLWGKRIEDLNALPEMRNPTQLAAIRIFRAINAAAYLAIPDLFPLLVFKQVNLSVKYGNTAESALAYTAYGITLCGAVGEIEAGYRFGSLALEVLDRLQAKELRAKVLFTVYHFLKPWRVHLRETLKPLLETYQTALETGDLEYAANTLNVYTLASFFAGLELVGLEREIATHSEAVDKIKQERARYFNELYRQTVLNLAGHSEKPWWLVGEAYNEEQMLPLHLEANDQNALYHLFCLKLLLSYLFRDYSAAVENADKLADYLDGVFGTIFITQFHFYDSLARLALFPEVPKSEQKRILKKVAANQKKLKKWARHTSMNILHKFYLVEAEHARVLDNEAQARECYDQAINLAREHNYINEEALASELAVQFYLTKGQTRVAGHYFRDAHYAYQRWGAVAKVNDLEKRHPQLLVQVGSTPGQEATATTTTTGAKTSSALDLASVLKASQAISGEIELDKLLIKLMSVVIENAGAQRGYLVLKKNGHWVIEAEGTIEEAKPDGSPAVTALQSIPIETSDDKLSPAIVNYVARTRDDVVLNDAAQAGLFTQDPYVVQNQPKSVLCTPLINQGKLTGILYLENNLTTSAFTSDRLEVLNLLSAQAAISIENASLYSHQVALTTGYSRFVPPEFLRFLSKESIVEVKLGDHVQQDMTVLFSDIRSFTTLSEMMTPQENFDFVNAYFGRVSPIIRQHNGIIVKYLGDGMMAVFPHRIEDALNAAIAKVKQVDHFNQDRQARGEVPIRIGIGIHTGKMTLGTVGEPERMQGDFLSDAVNLTARLEGLTKLYGASIVISQEALTRIEDPMQYQFRFLDRVQVKGRHEAVAVFEVFGGEPEAIIQLKLQTRTKFEEGLTFYYGQQFTAAGELFNEVLAHNPDDRAAKHYLDRSEHYLAHGAPDDWAGVRVLDEK